MSITIGFTDFIPDWPHEDSWVVFISFDHGTKIVVRPFFTFSSFWVSGIFFKETSVVIRFLATIPGIKGLFLNEQTKFCCDLQGLWTAGLWVVRMALTPISSFVWDDGILPYSFLLLQALPWSWCKETPWNLMRSPFKEKPSFESNDSNGNQTNPS